MEITIFLDVQRVSSSYRQADRYGAPKMSISAFNANMPKMVTGIDIMPCCIW
jgi:hypothetical protein